VILQSDLSPNALATTVGGLLADPAALETMKRQALERARPTAAADIARHVLSLIDLK
jgi:UDP-N-acetylglucosamine:LPS N-acetylglucosamine transferase